MTAVGIIPARWAASRFPGKVLAPIAGRPMLHRVVEGARRAKSLRAVLVATDDERVAAACREIDVEAVPTSPEHRTGTDRLAEVAAGLDDEIVVNVQGDEPLIEGFVIDAAVEALREDPGAAMGTVVHAMAPEAVADPNRVKVVLDRSGRALWFSRNPIPAAARAAAPPHYLQHVGLYVYRRAFLLEFVTLPQTPAELAEGLEQLRALEHGHAIRAARVEGWSGLPVDVPEDVAAVEARLAELAEPAGRTERGPC
jgi:3-deoxy-manno-octulosonate cytidylyltransferase (CMP-KDO synthetase)